MCGWCKCEKEHPTLFRVHRGCIIPTMPVDCSEVGPECKRDFEPRKKNLSYFPLYWLYNRDPYDGLFWSPYITGHLNNQGFFHCSLALQTVS